MCVAMEVFYARIAMGVWCVLQRERDVCEWIREQDVDAFYRAYCEYVTYQKSVFPGIHRFRVRVRACVCACV